MWGPVCNVYSPQAEEKREVLNKFISNLNADIQRLGLDKKQVIKIVESIYK